MAAQIGEVTETNVMRDCFLAAVSAENDVLDAFVTTLSHSFPSLVTKQEMKAPLSASEKLMVHSALTDTAAGLMEAAKDASVPFMEYTAVPGGQPLVPRLLNLIFLLVQRKRLEGEALQVLDDLQSTATIWECAGLVGYLEAKAPLLRQLMPDRAPGQAKAPSIPPAGLAVLRTTNSLLKRISRSADAALAGRIQLLVAKICQLCERSGVNLGREFNTAHQPLIEEVEEGAVDNTGQAIDADFYRLFWGLQRAFQDPYAVIAPARWAEMVPQVKAVLAQFRKHPVSASSSSSEGFGYGGEGSGVSVAYLSSARLMRLQLADAALRRHWLTQALILLQACRVPGRPPVSLLQPRSRADDEPETLKPKQVAELEELEGLLYSEMERTGEGGPAAAAAVRCSLAREAAWSGWKNVKPGAGAEACRPYERPAATAPPQPTAAAAPPPRKRQRKDGAVQLGTPELTRLWSQTADNLSALENRHVPQLRELLDDVIVEMDPEACVEEPYKRRHDPVYQWRVLRRVARTSYSTWVDLGKEDAHGDLEAAARRLYPEDVPKPAQPEEADPGGKASNPGEVSGPAEEPVAFDATAELAAADPPGALAASGDGTVTEGATPHSDREGGEEGTVGQEPEAQAGTPAEAPGTMHSQGEVVAGTGGGDVEMADEAEEGEAGR